MSGLQLSSEEFRHAADMVAQLCAEFLQTLDTREAFPLTSGPDTESLLAKAAPEHGLGTGALADLRLVAEQSRPPSPRFFGYVFGSGEPVAALGDLFASVLNQNVTAWRSAPAAVTIERVVVNWIAEAIGCGGFSGSLCGGGSSANLMALAMAREAKAPANERGVRQGIVYASAEAHMSIGKAVALLGLGRDNLRTIAVDDEFRMRPDTLERALAQDRSAGRVPVAVVATAGTVSTGAIDALETIAHIARAHGAWFHVDGAYGALAAMAVPEKFAGLNLADSLSLDPHKWLYQPADCGMLLYRDAGHARVAFSHTGEYARPLTEDPVEGFAFFEESMELSRRFRALKLWLSLRYHGLSAFRDAIRQDLANAERLRERIAAHPELELLAVGPLSAVCFRYVGGHSADHGELNELNQRILRQVVSVRRRVYFSNAVIRGKFALRACIVNHRARKRDVDLIVEEVIEAAREIA